MTWFIFIMALFASFFQPVWADHHGYGNQPGGSHRGTGQPYHYSDIRNPPQFTIYRDDGNSRYGSDPYHYNNIQNPPQFTIYRDNRPRR